MKFSRLAVLAISALVEAKASSDDEVQELFACHAALMGDLARRRSDDVASCNMWECLDRCSTRYGHADGFWTLSKLLLLPCTAVRHRPLTRGNGPAEVEEFHTWKSCVRGLAQDWAGGVGDRRAACDAFVCLTRTEVEFARGGVYSETAPAVETFCAELGESR